MGQSVRLKGVFRRLLSHDCSSSDGTGVDSSTGPSCSPSLVLWGEGEQRTVMSSYRLELFEE
jgi:hypothetical protein